MNKPCCTITKQLERSIVVGFLRRYTHHRQLAEIIAAGVHEKPESELRAWCAARGIVIVNNKEVA